MTFKTATFLRAETTSLQVLPIDNNALATLAVQDHGRKKPFTTFAHEMLLSMSGVTHLPVQNPDGSKIELPAEQVILDLWFTPEGWDDRPVIMLNFLALKKAFGLPEDRKLFSFNELVKQPELMTLLDQAQKLRQSGKGDNLTAIQKEAEASRRAAADVSGFGERGQRDVGAERQAARWNMVARARLGKG